MMTKYLLSMVLFFALLPAADAGAAKVRILVESPTGLQQKVYMTRPAGLTAERPIVLVMHGMRRNADEYRRSSASAFFRDPKPTISAMWPTHPANPSRGRPGHFLQSNRSLTRCVGATT